MFSRGLTAGLYGTSYGIRRDTGDTGKTGGNSQFVRKMDVKAEVAVGFAVQVPICYATFAHSTPYAANMAPNRPHSCLFGKLTYNTWKSSNLTATPDWLVGGAEQAGFSRRDSMTM